MQKIDGIPRYPSYQSHLHHMLSLHFINDHKHTYVGKISNRMGSTIHISYYKKQLIPPQIEYIVRIYSQQDLYEKQFIEKNNMLEKRLQSVINKGTFQIVGILSPISAVYLYDDVETRDVFFNKNPILYVCNLNEECEKCMNYFDKLEYKLRGNDENTLLHSPTKDGLLRLQQPFATLSF